MTTDTPAISVRYRYYWGLFALFLIAPVLAAIPLLGEVVPQCALVSASLAAIEVARLYKPAKQGVLAALRGGVFAIMAAIVLVFVIAAAYILRNSQAITAVESGWSILAGALYIVSAHVIAILLAARLKPTPVAIDDSVQV